MVISLAQSVVDYKIGFAASLLSMQHKGDEQGQKLVGSQSG